jgi:hypothetical protein
MSAASDVIIDPKRLTICYSEKPLGTGTSGPVFRGLYDSLPVAIKTVPSSAFLLIFITPPHPPLILLNIYFVNIDMFVLMHSHFIFFHSCTFQTTPVRRRCNEFSPRWP